MTPPPSTSKERSNNAEPITPEDTVRRSWDMLVTGNIVPTDPATPSPITPGDTVRQPLSASKDGGSDIQPLRPKLTQAIDASPAAAPPEATSAPAGKPSLPLQLAPIEFALGGSIGYETQRQTVGASKSMTQSLLTNVNATARSFIWQPWFAQVSGGLGLNFNTTSMTGSQISTTTDKTSSNIVSGNAALSLLPTSRFPFEAHFERSDSRQNSGLGAASLAYQTTRYGLTQRYTPLSGRAQYMVGYDRNLWESASLDKSKQDTFRAETTQQFTNQTLRISGDSTRYAQSSTNQKTVVNNLVSQHSYRPDPALSVESLANLVKTHYNLTPNENRFDYMQLSSSAYWRSIEKPLNVNGGVRLFGMSNDSITATTSTTSKMRGANANLGANYELSKHTRLNGSGNANVTDSNGTQTVTTNQTVGVTYQPDAVKLGAFDYTRSVTSNVSNSTDSLGSAQNLSLSPSHGLNRKIGLCGGTLGMNLDQAASFNVDTRNPSSSVLTHMGSLSWNLSEGQKTTLLRLNASDTRAMGGTPYSFQLINLQASLNESLSRNATWGGNLTIQATRQGTATAPTVTTTTSSADLSYRHQRAFDVSRLRFTSELRIYSDALIPVLATPNQQETSSWENRFDYSIGRLQLRLSARVAEVNKIKQSLLWFSVNRQF